MGKHKLITGPFGIKMRQETVKYLDCLLPTLKTAGLKRKQAVPSQIDFQEGERSEVSIITTNAVDREGEVVLPEGLDFSQFDLNPVVLWSHDYDCPPVGRCLWTKRYEDGFKAKTVYPEKPADYEGAWFPDEVWGLIKAEVLKAKSIGFLELESRAPSLDERNNGAVNIITKALVLEYSVCSVPMNQEAVVEAVAKGMLYSPRLLQELGYRAPEKSLPPVKRQPDLMPLVLKRLAELNFNPDTIVNKAVENLIRRGKV